MRLFTALSLSSNVTDWLANSCQPRLLHVFDRACNLINERGEVLSIVTPRIGNGPFNLVIAGLPNKDSSQQTAEVFSTLNVESPVSILGEQLILGDLTINTANAKLWNPRPNWEGLHDKRENITDLLITNYRECDLDTKRSTTIFFNPRLSITNYQFSSSLISNLSSVLVKNDVSAAKNIASKLAGLGPGLTPSGDDILLGAVYAAWIIHPPEAARALAEEIANTAAPLTTSLSAAWLEAGARGEAGELWHGLFNALLSANSSAIHLQITKLPSVGHTSGVDALTGFMGTILRVAKVAQTSNP
ncbi:MAG: DUF2877 domain-containing protein [Chloroflexota bacterium]